MSFIEAISSGFRNYVNFSGRALRSEYWYWALFVTIVLIPLGVVDEILYPGEQMGPFSWANGIIVIALILPSIAVFVRRLHDIDRKGWWYFITFTGIGTFVLLYWACVHGTPGPNRFGPEPMSRP
jgi:uncharacterized membrane protein YhaH (DUF805 family)